MLYTRKGDDGKSKLFACDERLMKNSQVFEVLGSLDELNSFSGLLRSKINQEPKLRGELSETVKAVQNDLFVIQAYIAGAPKKIDGERALWLENMIAEFEKEIPPIKSFIVPGETELSALADVIRCIARRVERGVVGYFENRPENIDESALIYLNRLSSFYFGLARLLSHRLETKEDAPSYN